MDSEYKFVLFFVLAVIFFGIHLISRKVANYNPETFPAVGIIERINQNDAGDTWYYIRLIVNGKEMTAKTDNYHRTPQDASIGDTVNVRYNYIAGGDVACYIDQQGFERVISNAEEGKPILMYCALAFLAIFAFFLVKRFLP